MASNPRLTAPALKVLKYLLEAPLEDRSGADLSRTLHIGSGTLYPLLARLEVAGWLTSKWEDVDPAEVGRPRRRFYRLSALGQARALKAINELQVGPGVLVWSY